MTPIDSTVPPRVESAEWITGTASLSSICVKRVLVVEDSYLVHQIVAENGCYVQLRERRKSGESQCVEKFFCMRREAPEGGGRKVKKKSKNRKLKNRKNRNPKFRLFDEKDRKAKNPRDRASRFEAIARTPEKASA
jgi:hypothetical protein